MSKKAKVALLLAAMTASCMLVARSDAPTLDLAARAAAGETAASKRAEVIPAAIAAGVVSVILSDGQNAGDGTPSPSH